MATSTTHVTVTRARRATLCCTHNRLLKWRMCSISVCFFSSLTCPLSNSYTRAEVMCARFHSAGKKYSEPMHARVYPSGASAKAGAASAASNTLAVAEMGCYGIGVSRLLAATLEAAVPATSPSASAPAPAPAASAAAAPAPAAAAQTAHLDRYGMVWPVSLAPYRVVLIPIGKPRAKSDAPASGPSTTPEAANSYDVAERLYDKLQQIPNLAGEWQPRWTDLDGC